MKNSIICITVFVIFFSCTKGEEQTPAPPSPPPTKPELATDSSSLTLKNQINTSDSFNINYTSNWTISVVPTTATWFKISALSGTGNTKIKLSVEQVNSTGVIKTATLEIRDSSSTLKKSISISQGLERYIESIADLPGVGRVYASSFTITDKIYVGLGSGIKDSREQNLNDFYEYNTTTKTWRQIADFPGEPRDYAAGFSINGKGYIVAGHVLLCPLTSGICDHVAMKDIWEYNPADNSWKLVGTYSTFSNDGKATGAVVIENRAYILQNQKLWAFDPADQYSVTPRADIPQLIAGNRAGFTIGTKGYFLGGRNSDGKSSLFEYTPASNSWIQKADLAGEGRRGSFSFSLNGRGYIGGGEGVEQLTSSTSQVKALGDLWEYILDTNSWKKIMDLPNQKPVSGVAGVANDVVIIGTGTTYPGPYYGNAFWKY